MTPKFDQIIHQVQGISITPVSEGVFRVYLLGYEYEAFHTARVSCMYNSVRKSWDTFDENMAGEYIAGGIWEHDWLRHWMMHLLLCTTGRSDQAMERLRDHAKERCMGIMNGLELEAV